MSKALGAEGAEPGRPGITCLILIFLKQTVQQQQQLLQERLLQERLSQAGGRREPLMSA